MGVTADTARSVAIDVWTPSRSRVRVSRDDDETKPSRWGVRARGTRGFRGQGDYGVTVTVACIEGWIMQVMLNVPAFEKVMDRGVAGAEGDAAAVVELARRAGLRREGAVHADDEDVRAVAGEGDGLAGFDGGAVVVKLNEAMLMVAAPLAAGVVATAVGAVVAVSAGAVVAVGLELVEVDPPQAASASMRRGPAREAEDCCDRGTRA